ncbi:MAG: hypothetical protein AABZ54_08165 [Bacteroidota bacterium]
MMELIQIIYNILLFGGTLLVCVIIISYLMSKSRIEEEASYNSADSRLNQKSLYLQRKINYEQELFRKKISSITPQIFPIADIKPKEVKIIRKPTVSKRDLQEEIRIEEKHLNKTNGNGKRYTIVNEERKKSRSRVANFYL